MNGDQIRDSFIRFFESKGHQHMPSASLIPAGAPTLLFTSAGMVPFKPFFMGEQTPPSKRLTSSQKSFRTTDIDEVGDHKHLTFFEMLGNFSIGDYFKEGAVVFCWELVTELFKLDPERLYVTIHLDDEEAFAIWRDQVGVPVERIYRYGDKDNWWGPAGNEGPTGPCSEVHYDGGSEKGCHDGRMMPPEALTAQFRKDLESGDSSPIDGCHPNCDCERFVELWNLVFMQFYQDTAGGRTPLPAPSVDTGMGLERAMVILQGKDNIYETDLFVPIIDRVGQLTGKTYGTDTDTDYAMRVVVEHARAAAFLIGDGVVPGNEGRGYVLRRVIRRAIRYGRQLGLEEAFLTEVVEAVIPEFSAVYKELSENHEFIQRVISLEEERVAEAIQTGLPLLEDGFIPIRKLLLANPKLGDIDIAAIDATLQSDEIAHAAGHGTLEIVGEALKKNLPSGMENQSRFFGTLSDAETFVLYDTYGFPPELTAEIAKEHGLEVDMEGFEREMDARKEQSRSSGSFSGSMEMQTSYSDLGLGSSEFVGYELTEQESKIAAILSGGVSVDHATQGHQVEIVISQSPFYAEGGGQLGDRGLISGPNGVVAVEDTQSPGAGLIVQRGTVAQGDISVGDVVTASVEVARRLDSSRNHSGTHILHAALRSVLGAHVRQAGSFVAPERLRFDFSHVSALTRDEL